MRRRLSRFFVLRETVGSKSSTANSQVVASIRSNRCDTPLANVQNNRKVKLKWKASDVNLSLAWNGVDDACRRPKDEDEHTQNWLVRQLSSLTSHCTSKLLIAVPIRCEINEWSCAEQTHARTHTAIDNKINYTFFSRFLFLLEKSKRPLRKIPLVLWVYLIRYSFFVVVVAKLTLSAMCFNTPMYYTKANTVQNRRERKILQIKIEPPLLYIDLPQRKQYPLPTSTVYWIDGCK